MNAFELGIDRTVLTTWTPDDTWPALLDEYAIADDEPSAAETVGRPGLQHVGGGGSAADHDPALRTDLDVPPEPADTVAPIPDDRDVADLERRPVEALAAVDGHPLHPVLVPLPIGAFVGAFIADVAYLQTHDRFWARGARLLTTAGLATGLLAGSLGAIDFTGRRRIRRHRSAWVHGAGNLAVLGLALGSVALRRRDERRGVTDGGVVISATIATVLLVTGWLGGELAYRDRVGVIGR
jgi:uncharacterized membrane protein